MNWYDEIEDRAVAAYRQHGLKAMARRFTPYQDELKCCALGAINLGVEENYIEAWRQNLGAPSAREVWDFIYAFDRAMDGHPTDEDKLNTLAAGAGYRTAERVKAEGLAA